MENAVAVQGDKTEIIESVLVSGDLSKLSQEQRTNYYMKVCDSVGLNPLTKPFEYIVLNDKLTLYARKDATDQLRQLHNISVQIVSREKIEGVYVVTARASTPEGRQDESIGAVSVERENGEWKVANSGKKYLAKDGTVSPLRGDDLANAIMKAETKAKRRATLSLCGLGILDETEVETIKGAQKIDSETGEITSNGSGVYRPTDPARPYKDDYTISTPVLSDGTLNFDSFAAEIEDKIEGTKNTQELSMWNRANAKTLRAMEKERPDLFQNIGELFRTRSQSLM